MRVAMEEQEREGCRKGKDALAADLPCLPPVVTLPVHIVTMDLGTLPLKLEDSKSSKLQCRSARVYASLCSVSAIKAWHWLWFPNFRSSQNYLGNLFEKIQTPRFYHVCNDWGPELER